MQGCVILPEDRLQANSTQLRLRESGTAHPEGSPYPIAPAKDETLDGLIADALELGLAIQKKYGIKIDADAKDTRNHFSNVASLAAFVTAKQAA